MSALADLREDFETVRAERLEGRATKNAEAIAYERWFHAAAEEGAPPDALRRYTTNEAERFWAYTIPGLDGHVYWDGPDMFRTNAGNIRRPVRWAWERANGKELSRYKDIRSTCGEANCIAAGHQEVGVWRQRRYTDMQMIGALQVAAMRLGHTPSLREWNRLKMRPDEGTLRLRWGSWSAAVKAAGLKPNTVGAFLKHDRESCIRGLRALARHLGRPPSAKDWNTQRPWLSQRGHPTSPTTVKQYLGSPWTAALKKAGLR